MMWTMHLIAIHGDGAAIPGVNAEQALHQGGFASAVFAHQRMHGAGAQLQLGVIQCLYAGELLFNIQHLQQVLIFGHVSSSPLFRVIEGGYEGTASYPLFKRVPAAEAAGTDQVSKGQINFAGIIRPRSRR